MDHSFWNERWQQGQIGFHLDRPNPNLVAFADALGPATGRVLVPLCGKSQDLSWLAERGHEVVGVEFVAQAVEAYFSERGVEPAHGRVGGLPARRHQHVTLVVGDFFAVMQPELGPLDAIYDRAALVAVEPPRRADYVKHLATLARPGTKLLLVTFHHDMNAGPPFSVPVAEVERLFSGWFTLEQKRERDILEAEPRFRARGATFMREQVFTGERVA